MADKVKPIIVTDEHFGDLIDRYQSLKEERNGIDKEMTSILEEIETYTDVDKATPFEGRVKLESGNYRVTVEYKVNTKIDVEEAKKLVKLYKLDPEHIFNVKYEYSKTKLGDLTEQEYGILDAVASASRGKSGLEIKEIKK